MGFLFAESFDEAGGWSLGETSFGASSITQGGLVLSARQPSAAVLALAPTEPLTDFEAEILVRPEVCADDDEFGLVFRSNPLGEHYRVALTCAGTARLVRLLTDQTRSLIPPSATSAIIPGAGSSNRLKVIARGPDLLVLVNDQEVLSGRDTALAAGRIGTFAKAGRGGQVTVRFDDLRVLPAAATPPAP